MTSSDLARLVVWSHMKMRCAAVETKSGTDRGKALILMFHALRAASRIRGSNAVEDALPKLWE